MTTQTLWTVENLEREMDYPASVENIVNILNVHQELVNACKDTVDGMIITGLDKPLVMYFNQLKEALDKARKEPKP